MVFTAVFIPSADGYGYVGFLEEVPHVVSRAPTLELAREELGKVAAVVFDETRRESEGLIAGKSVLREPFMLSPA
jgi:predicted RNase H-like HicB family nuclease